LAPIFENAFSIRPKDLAKDQEFYSALGEFRAEACGQRSVDLIVEETLCQSGPEAEEKEEAIKHLD